MASAAFNKSPVPKPQLKPPTELHHRGRIPYVFLLGWFLKREPNSKDDSQGFQEL